MFSVEVKQCKQEAIHYLKFPLKMADFGVLVNKYLKNSSSGTGIYILLQNEVSDT